jgi:hypothetical protein
MIMTMTMMIMIMGHESKSRTIWWGEPVRGRKRRECWEILFGITFLHPWKE